MALADRLQLDEIGVLGSKLVQECAQFVVTVEAVESNGRHGQRAEDT